MLAFVRRSRLLFAAPIPIRRFMAPPRILAATVALERRSVLLAIVGQRIGRFTESAGSTGFSGDF